MRARQLDVPIIDTMYVTQILTRDAVVFGAYGFDIGDGTRYVVHADAVVLAAGGHTRIWRRTSSRRDENTGARSGSPSPELSIEIAFWELPSTVSAIPATCDHGVPVRPESRG